MRKRFLLTLLSAILLAAFPFSAYGSLDDVTVSDDVGDPPIYGPGLQGGPYTPTVETVESITQDSPELFSQIKLRGSITHNGNTDIITRGFEFGLTQTYGTNIDVPAPDEYSIDRTWGEAGSGESQFSYIPFGGMAADGQGNVYVADFLNFNIQKFDRFGHFLFSFGTRGMDDGEFEFISSMATDSANNLYVTDFQTNHARIQKFDSDGNRLLTFGSYGETNANSEFVVPRGIDVDSTGKIYVGDPAADRVQVFSSAGIYESSFGATGSGVGQYTEIVDIVIDNSDNIYITDTDRDDVQKFDSEWNHLITYSLNEYGQPFSDIWQIAVDSSENVFIHGEIWDLNGNFQGRPSTWGFGATINRIAIGPDDAVYGASDTSVVKFTPPEEIPLSWFEADLSDLDCATEYHFRAFSTNDEGTSYGEDQTFTLQCPWDFAFDVELLNESPVVASDSVSYEFTVTNLSEADAPYMGGVYIITPAEFVFSSNGNSAVLCYDQGLAEDSGDPYIATLYSGHHFLICIPVEEETILGNGGTLKFTLDGTATSDFENGTTVLRSLYVDPEFEPEFSEAFNNAYGTGVDFTTLPFNNVAVSVYGETPDPPATTTTTTSASQSSTTTSTGTSPTTTQPNVATTTQPITPVEESTTSTTTTAVTTTNPNQPTETTSPGNTAGEPVPDSGGEDTNHSDSPWILGLFTATGAFILRNIFLVSILLLIGGTITFVARRRKKIA